MRGSLISVFGALSPFVKKYGEPVLTIAGLAQVGAGLYRGSRGSDGVVPQALGFARDVGLELLGQKELPVGDAEEETVKMVEAESPASFGGAAKVPLMRRPAPSAAPSAVPAVAASTATPSFAQLPRSASAASASLPRASIAASSRQYEMGQGDTAATVARKYGATGRNWRAELAAENPGVDLDGTDRLNIPNTWGSFNPAAPLSGTEIVACKCAGPILAGSADRVVLRQCAACRERAIAGASHHLQMNLGWAEAWKDQTGTDPRALGGECGEQPDMGSAEFNSDFGFEGDAFSAKVSGWQQCMHAKAAQVESERDVGDGAPGATASATPEAPAASAGLNVAPPGRTQAAKSAVAQTMKHVDKKVATLATEAAKAPEGPAKEALTSALEQARAHKAQASTIVEALSTSAPAHVVDAVHEHAAKGHDQMAQMIPAIFAMISEGGYGPTVDLPPWGSPPAVETLSPAMTAPPTPAASELQAMSSFFDEAPLDLPLAGVPETFDLPTIGGAEESSDASSSTSLADETQIAGQDEGMGAFFGGSEETSLGGVALYDDSASVDLGLSMDDGDLGESLAASAKVEEPEAPASSFEMLLEGMDTESQTLALAYADTHDADETREYAEMLRVGVGSIGSMSGSGCRGGCPIRNRAHG